MSVETALILEMMRAVAGGSLVAAGLLFMAGGALGMFRFPDFYTRLHAMGVSDAVGVVLVLVGLAIAAWDERMSVRLLLLAALIVAAAPTIRHMSANAAHAAGLAPLAGSEAVQRPGQKK